MELCYQTGRCYDRTAVETANFIPGGALTGLGLGWSPGETLLVIMAIVVTAMSVFGVDRQLFRSKKSAPPRELPPRRHRVSYVVDEASEVPVPAQSATVSESVSRVPIADPALKEGSASASVSGAGSPEDCT